jgi:molybdate transport system ATP-binding protein
LLKIDFKKTFHTSNRTTIIRCYANIQLGVTTALYGRSGVGKSTILRIIAGLSNADSGLINFKGKYWFNDKINLPISDRKIGFVFQDFNLFPNMTVEGNLKYASNNSTISEQIYSILKDTFLIQLLKSYPNQLSGGEKQRISIIRSLCLNPELLLLDEPFSALDDESIGEIMHEISVIQKKMGTTVVLVSHRKDVILKMADSVVHMKQDLTCQQGEPKNILTKSF